MLKPFTRMSWMPTLSTRLSKRRITLGSAGCAVIGIVAAVLALQSGSNAPAPYRNVSGNYRVCLLSETAGAGGAAVPASSTVRTVAAAWAGLERAAASGKVNAERLPLSGTSVSAAAPYFNGALQQHCSLIVSVGPELGAAVDAAADVHRDQQYLLVGSASARRNVHTIAFGSASAITSETYSMVMSLANA